MSKKVKSPEIGGDQ